MKKAVATSRINRKMPGTAKETKATGRKGGKTAGATSRTTSDKRAKSAGATTAGSARSLSIKRAGKSARYLSQLKSFYRKNKRMPSYGEIAELLKFKSKFAALYQVNKWIEAGIISRDKAGKLLPGKQFQPLKVLGMIKAGWPSPAEEENADTISLDDWLIPNKEGSFMLKVTGDSMVDAGIMPGDMVIINRGRQAKSGDIVVAEVDRAWTVKYFIREGGTGGRSDDGKSGAGKDGRAGSVTAGGRVVLKAANKKYPPIVPREELRVAGVVTAVVRKY